MTLCICHLTACYKKLQLCGNVLGGNWEKCVNNIAEKLLDYTEISSLKMQSISYLHIISSLINLLHVNIQCNACKHWNNYTWWPFSS